MLLSWPDWWTFSLVLRSWSKLENIQPMGWFLPVIQFPTAIWSCKLTLELVPGPFHTVQQKLVFWERAQQRCSHKPRCLQGWHKRPPSALQVPGTIVSQPRNTKQLLKNTQGMMYVCMYVFIIVSYRELLFLNDNNEIWLRWILLGIVVNVRWNW